jgi:hypothetical protein
MHTGEHGDFVDIIELAITFSIKCSPQVCNEDLSALQKAYFFPLKRSFVLETTKLFCK